MEQQVAHLSAAILLLSICVGTPAHAQTAGESPSTSWANSPYMVGNWGGERTALERSGIVFNFISLNDVLVDARSDAANWSRVRGARDIDFGKGEQVQGMTFHITALWQAGGNTGTDIGSIANPGRLVSADSTQIPVGPMPWYQWWGCRSAPASPGWFVRLARL